MAKKLQAEDSRINEAGIQATWLKRLLGFKKRANSLNDKDRTFLQQRGYLPLRPITRIQTQDRRANDVNDNDPVDLEPTLRRNTGMNRGPDSDINLLLPPNERDMKVEEPKLEFKIEGDFLDGDDLADTRGYLDPRQFDLNSYLQEALSGFEPIAIPGNQEDINLYQDDLESEYKEEYKDEYKEEYDEWYKQE